MPTRLEYDAFVVSPQEIVNFVEILKRTTINCEGWRDLLHQSWEALPHLPGWSDVARAWIFLQLNGCDLFDELRSEDKASALEILLRYAEPGSPQRERIEKIKLPPSKPAPKPVAPGNSPAHGIAEDDSPIRPIAYLRPRPGSPSAAAHNEPSDIQSVLSQLVSTVQVMAARMESLERSRPSEVSDDTSRWRRSEGADLIVRSHAEAVRSMRRDLHSASVKDSMVSSLWESMVPKLLAVAASTRDPTTAAALARVVRVATVALVESAKESHMREFYTELVSMLADDDEEDLTRASILKQTKAARRIADFSRSPSSRRGGRDSKKSGKSQSGAAEKGKASKKDK